jgi:O-antigen/teichoic acid export membrane protein
VKRPPPVASVGRGVVAGLAADAVVVVSSLVLSIVVSRFLGTTGRGIYFLTVLAATLGASIADLGVSTVAVTMGARRSEVAETHALAIATAAVTGAVGAALLIGFEPQLVRALLTGLDYRYVAISAIALPLMVYAQIGGSLLAGLGHAPAMAAIRAQNAVLGLGLTLIAVIATDGSTLAASLGWLLSVAVWAASTARGLRRHGVGITWCSPRQFVGLLGFGLRAYVGTISHYGFLRIDVLFVSARLGPNAVGIYSVASLLAERITLVGSAVYNASAARIGGESRQQAMDVVARLVRLILLVGAPAAVLLALVARPLIVTVYGHDFGAAATPFTLLLPGTIALTLWYVLGLFVITALGRPGTTTLIQGVGLAASMPLYALAIPRWGLEGAAGASTVVYVLVLALGATVFVRAGAEMRSLVPRLRDARDLLAIRHAVRAQR